MEGNCAYVLEILVERSAHGPIGAASFRTPEIRVNIQQQNYLTHIVCTLASTLRNQSIYLIISPSYKIECIHNRTMPYSRLPKGMLHTHLRRFCTPLCNKQKRGLTSGITSHDEQRKCIADNKIDCTETFSAKP